MAGEHGCAGGGGGEFRGTNSDTVDHPGMADIANLQPLPAAASASAAGIPDVDEASKSPEPRSVGLSFGPLMLKQMEDEVVKANPKRRLLGQSRNPSFLSL